MSTLLVPVLLVSVVLWLLAPFGRRRADGPGVEPVEDEQELRAAEQEVQDLGAHQDPEEGWQGDDWGPGAGPRPRQ